MLEKVSLFKTKRDFLIFLLACGILLAYSILIEFQNYKQLTQFDSNVITATILKQYTKVKKTKKGKIKTYQVLKLKSNTGFSFYTTASKKFPFSKGKKLHLKIWTTNITFYQYMTSFYTYSKVLFIDKTITIKQQLNSYLSQVHKNQNIANIYQALYTARPLKYELQTIFSTLGISHLFAISGFHLGVLGGLLFFLLRYPYQFLQDRYFPYRNSKIDLFILVAILLFSYMIFLDSPASLMRAFGMFLVGFILYDRGIKIISMQTLFLTALLLLSIFPRLFFGLGFWLSFTGVFYIFLFLIHFKHLNKIWQFILVPFWVYLLMLPISLSIFSNFSIYHPLSILWTSLFTIFYPLSIFLHLIGFGYLFDNILQVFINIGTAKMLVELEFKWIIIQILLSLLGMWKKSSIYLLLIFDFSILIYAIYQVT